MHLVGRDEVEREKREKRRELHRHLRQVVEHVADRHREAREVHLAEEPRVRYEHVAAVAEAAGEILPQHRSRIVEEDERDPVRADLREVPEHERVHDRRDERVDDEPQRPQDRLLVLRDEVPLHEQPHEVAVANHLAELKVEELSLGLDDEIPVFGRV